MTTPAITIHTDSPHVATATLGRASYQSGDRPAYWQNGTWTLDGEEVGWSPIGGFGRGAGINCKGLIGTEWDAMNALKSAMIKAEDAATEAVELAKTEEEKAEDAIKAKRFAKVMAFINEDGEGYGSPVAPHKDNTPWMKGDDQPE